MAIEQINDYGVGDVDLTSVMETLDAQRQGYHKVSLTNMDSTGEPEICEGSKIEINGALFEVDTDTAISGSPSDGDVYIKLTPSGTSAAASYTNVAPTWDDEKGGWYEAATNNRYLNFKMVMDSGSWYNKIEFPNSYNFGGDRGEINCYHLEDETGEGTQLATASKSVSGWEYQEFKLFKPITGFLKGVNNGTSHYQYNFQLNPGYYRLGVSYGGSGYNVSIDIMQNNIWVDIYTLDCTQGINGAMVGYFNLMGVYGISNSNDLDRIRELF